MFNLCMKSYYNRIDDQHLVDQEQLEEKKSKRQWRYPYDSLENKQYNLLECDRI